MIVKKIFILKWVSFLITPLLMAQVTFIPHCIANLNSDGVGAESIIAIDLDGDGDIDLLTLLNRSITWFENGEDMIFTAHNITTEDVIAASIDAVDLDGDNDIDVVTPQYWYENNGNKSFTFHRIPQGINTSNQVFAIDIDDDDDLDLITIHLSMLYWYENDGYQNFSVDTLVTNLWGGKSVYAIDMDGDGDIDLVSSSSITYKMAWYENDSSEIFSEHILEESSIPTSIFVLDMDCDDDMDIVSVSFTTAYWYENDGNQNFTKKVITSRYCGYESYCSLAIFPVDIDNDSDMDVVSASYEDIMPEPLPAHGTISLHKNNGKRQFISHTIFKDEYDTFSIYNVKSIFAVDMDRDGDIDIVTGSGREIVWYENIFISGIDISNEITFRLNSINYPNPFNPSTIINYQLPMTCKVELSIYNLLGQKVAVLVSERQQAGQYKATWDASAFASGIYYYLIKAGEFRQVRKMVLVR